MSHSRKKIAKSLGADVTIDPLTKNTSDIINNLGIKKINTVIECVGKTVTMKQAIAPADKKALPLGKYIVSFS